MVFWDYLYMTVKIQFIFGVYSQIGQNTKVVTGVGVGVIQRVYNKNWEGECLTGTLTAKITGV